MGGLSWLLNSINLLPFFLASIKRYTNTIRDLLTLSYILENLKCTLWIKEIPIYTSTTFKKLLGIYRKKIINIKGVPQEKYKK